MQKLLTIYLTELRRSLLIWWSYRLDFISDIVLWIVAFPLMMVMFDSVANGYGPNRQMASLIGFLVWDLCMSLLGSTTREIKDESQEGTLETVLLSPLSPTSVFTLRITAGFTRQVLQTLLLAVILILILQLRLFINTPALIIILLTMLTVGGVGLALGGLAMVYKNIASVVGVVALLAQFFTGAIIPLNDLGLVFTVIRYTIPTAWGIDALRQTLLDGRTLLDFVSDGTLLGLGLQAVLFVGIGVTVFRWGFRRTQQQGSLGAY